MCRSIQSRRQTSSILFTLVLVASWAGSSASGQTCLPEWVPGSPMPGTDNTIQCSVLWTRPGAEKPWLVIGGKFRVAGNVVANGVAAWDGENWHAFGTGVTDENYFEVNALEVYNGDLYIGGWFDGIGGKPIAHLARWDGSEWQAVGEGVSGWTRALHVFNGDLIAGGDFTMAGGSEALRIAKWNGAEWSNVGAGFSHGVYSLHTHNGELIAGGCFGTSGGTSLSRIARWDGSLWQPIGAGISGSVVFDMTTYQGDLIAVGNFFSLAQVARWSGTEWLLVGNLSYSAHTVTVFQGELVVGGEFLKGVVRMIGSEWHPFGYGPLGLGVADWSAVFTLVEYDGDLFAGGDILSVENQPVRNLARWTGTNWNSYGVGSEGTVRAYARHGGDSFVSGDLINSGYVAQWQNGVWTTLGAEFNARVSTLISYNGYLIAGGNFTFSLDGTFFGIRIAKWDGQQWSNMGGFNGEILKFLTIDDDLIAVGAFTLVGGSPTSRIARWNGQAWQPMFPGTDFNGTVRDIIRIAGNYFVAGDFTAINAQPISYIARWDGMQWHGLSSTVNAPAHALTHFQGELIAGGAFTIAGDVDAKAIARWDGRNWNSLGIGLLPCEGQSCQAVVRSLVTFGDVVFAAGVFNYASNSHDELLESVNFAQWDGSQWSAIPPGVGTPAGSNGGVHFMTADNSSLILTGLFIEAGGQPANNIVAFTPGSLQTWFTVGNGFDSSINDIAEINNDLIIAGNFQNSPGGFHNRITRWDGSDWHDLDGGMDGSVRALEVYDNSLVAGGLFTFAGDASAKSLAKWNGSSWTEVAPVTGSFGEVRALTVCGQDLYIAGQFQSVGGVATPNIARWDGNAAHPVGTDLTGSISALAFFEGDLIASGALLITGTPPVYGVARWDGAAWHALGAGVSNCPTGTCVGNVYALTVHDEDLIVGGSFAYAGGQPASNIARWDGKGWHAMGAGINGIVRALYSFRGNLYAAGNFTLADGILVHRIAVWDGLQWSALPGGGLDSACYGSSCNASAGMLAAYKGDLYVGGSFSQAGPTASPYFARLVNTCTSGDVYSDGAVGLVDLLHIISHWGPCTSSPDCDDSPCNADLNFNGLVDVQDLLIVITNWTG